MVDLLLELCDLILVVGDAILALGYLPLVASDVVLALGDVLLGVGGGARPCVSRGENCEDGSLETHFEKGKKKRFC